MNAAASVLLIFVLVAGAFAGLGYLIPEVNRQATELQNQNSRNEQLTQENEALGASNAELSAMLQQERAAQQEAQNKLEALEAKVQEEKSLNATLLHALEVERLEKAKALEAMQELTRLNTSLMSQLQGEVVESGNSIPVVTELDQTSGANSVKLLGLVSPLLLFLLVLLGFEFHRRNSSHRLHKSLWVQNAGIRGPNHSPNSGAKEAFVTVQIPQRSIPDFVKWFRQIR